MTNKIGIDQRTVQRLSAIYRQRWGVGLCAARPDGRVLWRAPGCLARAAVEEDPVRRLAIDEALRWGDPEVQAGPRGLMVWAVPLLYNARLTGGLVAAITEQRLFPGAAATPCIDTRAACFNLRQLAEECNLTNAALLESRRHAAQRERSRAEAIHAFKVAQHYDLRTMYQLDEPLLVAAISRGDRHQARALLNRLLVGLMQRAGDRLDLVKSFFMELVVTLCRAAVEAGGAPEELLGANFASIAELSRIDDDAQLAAWLHVMLERIMDAIRRHHQQAHPAMLTLALQYMAQHCGTNISRQDVARQAGLSPAHFSRFFKRRMGRGFTEVLNQMRVERAADLIANSDKDLKLITQETGFADQSYFTKIFRRLQNMTPAQYRRQHR